MILILAAAAASFPIASTAILPADRPREVRYRDLDLSTPAGAAALHSRVRRAIDVMCADPSGPSPAVVIDRDCREQAWASVRPQLDATLTAADEQSGTELAVTDPIPAER